MTDAVTNDKAWEYYGLAAAAAVPVFVTSTVVGIALDTHRFVDTMIHWGPFSAAAAGYCAYSKLQKTMPFGKEDRLKDKVIWNVCGYATLGSLLIGGSLFNLGHRFAGRTALVADLNGAVAAGTLGIGLASVIAAGTHYG